MRWTHATVCACSTLLALTLCHTGTLCAQDAAAGEPLERQLDRIAASLPMGRAHLGMHVVDLSDGSVLYDRRGEVGCIPASNVKLVTAAAALDVLGADFKYVTRLGWIGENLVVIASGDPATGDARVLAADPTLDDSIYGVFDAWAAQVAAGGRTAVRGDLVVDDTVFDRQFFHPSWADQPHSAWYAAQVGGANFNDNCVDITAAPGRAVGQPAAVRLMPETSYVQVINTVTTGRRSDGEDKLIINRTAGGNAIRIGGTCGRPSASVQNCTIDNPPGFFATVLAERLRLAGVIVSGEIKLARVRTAAGEVPAAFRPIAEHSTPLAVVLKRTCKHSQNLFAEAVLKTMGAYHKPPEGAALGAGSWETGRAAVAAYLARIGIAEGGYVYDDGGGLSKLNRFSPKQLTTVLAAAWKAPARQTFLDALSIAGVDGTLADRMTEGAAKGRVFGKTGFVRGVSATSGYVFTASGRHLAFSFLFNQVVSNRDAKEIMDRLCRRLAEQ
jgi:D-alanyl-D-alanine carboxypeptidase/D-alanyl-D-alanine-endopeptidase (penicillin-binding protein 4)